MRFASTAVRLASITLTVIALAACGGGGDNNTQGNPPPNTPPPVTNPATEAPVSFAVDSRIKLVGLGFTFEAFPVVLFRDGRALTDTVGLIFPAGLVAHREQYPSTWTQWRASGSDVEILQPDSTWKRITASNVAPMATGEFTVSGIYESLSVGASPSMTVISSSQYTFTHAGAFGKGGYVVGEAAPVSAISTTPDRRGTYIVDGHRLTLRLETGAVEQHVVVFKETDSRYIFIDGAMYSLR